MQSGYFVGSLKARKTFSKVFFFICFICTTFKKSMPDATKSHNHVDKISMCLQLSLWKTQVSKKGRLTNWSVNVSYSFSITRACPTFWIHLRILESVWLCLRSSFISLLGKNIEYQRNTPSCFGCKQGYIYQSFPMEQVISKTLFPLYDSAQTHSFLLEGHCRSSPGTQSDSLQGIHEWEDGFIAFWGKLRPLQSFCMRRIWIFLF